MKGSLMMLILLIGGKLSAQDYSAQFVQAFQAGDTEAQLSTLQQWEKEDPKNAELHTSFFNYYFFKSKQEVLSLETEAPEGESLELSNENGEVAGFIGSQVLYNADDLKMAFKKIDRGIQLYPDRLDMRLGKIYALGQTAAWNLFTETIIEVIDRSQKNKNSWKWTNNEKREDGESLLLGAIQDYQLQLYNTEDDDLLSNIARIAETILTYYPNHIESLANLSITYLLAEQYDQAIAVLKKAEAINPKDTVVLGNIAECYARLENNKQAIVYYEKMITYGDDQTQEFAEQRIADLKK